MTDKLLPPFSQMAEAAQKLGETIVSTIGKFQDAMPDGYKLKSHPVSSTLVSYWTFVKPDGIAYQAQWSDVSSAVRYAWQHHQDDELQKVRRVLNQQTELANRRTDQLNKRRKVANKLNSEVRSLRSQLQEIVELALERRKKIDDLAEVNVRLVNKLANAETEKAKLQGEVRARDQRIRDLSTGDDAQNLRTLVKSLRQDAEKLAESNAYLQEQLQPHVRAHSAIKAENTNLVKENRELKLRLDNQAKYLGQLQKVNERLNSEKAGAEHNARVFHEKSLELDAQLKGAHEANDDLCHQLKAAKDDYASRSIVYGQLQELDRQNANCRQAIDSLEKTLARIRGERDKAEELMYAAERRERDALQEIRRLEADQDDLKTEVQTLRGNLVARNRQLEELGNANMLLAGNNVSDLLEQVEYLQKQVGHRGDQIDRQMETINQYQAEVARLWQAINEARRNSHAAASILSLPANDKLAASRNQRAHVDPKEVTLSMGLGTATITICDDSSD